MYYGYISAKNAERAKHMDVQMKFAVFKPFDLISIRSFLHISKMACIPYKIHITVAMWLFQHFIEVQEKISQATLLWAKEDDICPNEGKQISIVRL